MPPTKKIGRQRRSELRARLELASRPPADGSCPFMKLPTEVRNEIYHYLFAGASVQLVHTAPDTPIADSVIPRENLYNRLSIAFTCRLCYAEAPPVLAEELKLDLYRKYINSDWIPSVLREIHFPRVRSAELSDSTVDFDPTLLPNLRTLHWPQSFLEDGMEDRCIRKESIEQLLDAIAPERDQDYIKERMEEPINEALDTEKAKITLGHRFDAAKHVIRRSWLRMLQHKERTFKLIGNCTVFLQLQYICKGSHLVQNMILRLYLTFDMETFEVICRRFHEGWEEEDYFDNIVPPRGTFPDFDINEDVQSYLRARLPDIVEPEIVMPDVDYDSWDED